MENPLRSKTLQNVFVAHPRLCLVNYIYLKYENCRAQTSLQLIVCMSLNLLQAYSWVLNGIMFILKYQSFFHKNYAQLLSL